MSEVIDFPPKKPAQELLIGPFEEWRVVVQGRVVPRLTGRKVQDRIHLTVDGRFGAEFSSEADASQAAWLIAQASAVAAGYPHFEATTREQPFAPIAMQVDPPGTA